MKKWLPQKVSNKAFWVVVLALIVSDQLTKWIVQQQMNLHDTIPLIPNIFHITYILNPGAAFGLMAYQKSFFIVVTLIVLLAILYFYRKIPPEQSSFRLGLAFQGGGATGNLIDRVKEGYVVDFIDFRIWPVFNIADIAITLGVILLIYSIVTMPEEDEKIFK
ncbi:signal peptidase II [Heliorestis acidaminivorans]|uniref:signal peptidase II n=1 Tax=Heliorestis acidaminivorans TaxID=553427 RepID=UPI001FA94241|nr:signal peptidase II [Heliorestis acidaminivorans]